MRTINGTTLADMTIKMLERTAMVLAEPVAEGDEHPQPTRYARITCRGPSRGTLVLGANDGFLREVSASLLGVDAAEVHIDTHGCDALKEMANILGGLVIHAMTGEACEYSLGLPELLTMKVALDQVSGPASAVCTVIAEGGALRVYWHEVSIAEAA